MQSSRQKPRLRGAFAFFLAGLVGLVAGGCSKGPRSDRGRGILIIAVDGLRADHLGIGGYDRPTAPQLDRLAARGVYFSQTFAAAPAMIPAHAAILTGCDPGIARRPPLPMGMIGSLPREWRIPLAVPTLARELLAAGFATAAFVDHPWLAGAFGFSGGFERYYGFREDVPEGQREVGIEGSATRFRRWLRELSSDRDWFAYLTVYDLLRAWRGSDPTWDTYFEPREELARVPPVADVERVFFAIPHPHWPGGSLSLGEYEARYDGALRRLDGLIQRLLGELHAMGRMQDTTVCVVGSFGVGFGESGLVLDHGTLSDVDLHVPWILVPSPSLGLALGRRIDHLASTIDLAPTLLELAGVDLPQGMHGRSHVAVLRGAGEPARTLAFAQGGVHRGFAVRTAELSYQYVLPGAGGPPTLSRSWFGTADASAAAWREHLRDRRSGSGPGDLEPSANDPDATRRLRAAGEEWYRWIELARDALHTVPWRTDPVPDELRAELRGRGLIPPPLRTR